MQSSLVFELEVLLIKEEEEANGFCIAKDLWIYSTSGTWRPSVDHKILLNFSWLLEIYTHTHKYVYISKLEKE